MSEILVASAHSGLDERQMEDAVSPKIVLKNKEKPRKIVLFQKCQPPVMGLLTDYTQNAFFLIKNVTDYKLFVKQRLADIFMNLIRIETTNVVIIV